MEDFQKSLDRIEAEVSKKPSVSPWITSVIIPILIAAVTAFLSIQSASSGDRANQLKQIEVLHTVISDFSPTNPERTLVLLDVVKATLPLEKGVASKLEAYALSLTSQKVKTALAEGGVSGAAKLEEVLTVVSSANTLAAKSISNQITNERFHVIAVSDTTKELASSFKSQLIKAGFDKSEIISTSTRYSVSLGEFEYENAKKVQQEFQAHSRFHPAYANEAFLERQKPSWTVIK
jgi:hypothetical protein